VDPLIIFDSNLQKLRTKHQPKLVGGFNHLEKYESQWEG
jgi:hypothetical protein